ncbi:MAG TPA: GNAT family N-acetyltransferase [Xanthobacteraceae bacterium]|jgi:N-acetylglutamate synthase-like GNAT family acetyltransferase
MTGRGLLATPLAAWERDGVKTALRKAGLPADEVDDPRHMFWRFETATDVPVGFGGLEIYAPDALLRSVVTLPPLRMAGMGSSIVEVIEGEARAYKCRSMYLVTRSEAEFFGRLGYLRCMPKDVPDAIRSSRQFDLLRSSTATAMVKAI